MTDGPTSLFVYGTLCDDAIRAGVLGRALPAPSICAAAAPGWCTVYYPGRSYPALKPDAGAKCPGLVLEGLTHADLDRLDAFEGAEYARGAITIVSAHGTETIQAYFPTVPITDTARAWTFDAWAQAHRDTEMARYRATDFSGEELDLLMAHDQDRYETAKGDLIIVPIHHASFVMTWNSITIFCDPVGGAERFADFAAPDLVMLTHHHGDHLDVETLEAITGEGTRIVAPKLVADQLPPALAARTETMANGSTTTVFAIPISAVAMYNTTPDRQKYHEKGVGNGYLFDFAGTRVYLASDTEPTPEMDGLGAIDIAFFPMNLPYTMTPDQVVTCIEKTRPRYVYPFHYRFPFDDPGTDPQALVALMPEDSQTQIVVRDWYALD